MRKRPKRLTPEGWREFMTWLAGYVDDKGCPTGSSVFTATGDHAEELRAFLEANKDKLKLKGQREAAGAPGE